MAGCDITQAAFLATVNRRIFKKFLYDPHWTVWGDLDEQSFFQQYERIEAALDGSERDMGLLHWRLLAALCLHAGGAPRWYSRWLRRHAAAALLTDMDLKDLTAGSWVTVPLLLRGQGIHRRHLLVGSLPDAARTSLIPRRAEGLFDAVAREALTTAAAVAAEQTQTLRSFCCFPLVGPSPAPCITGASLALPAALGFSAAAVGQPPQPGIAASGALNAAGDVLPVGDMARKIRAAARYGCKAFVAPMEGGFDEADPRIEVLPAACFDQAVFYWRLFSPRHRHRLVLYERMCRDAALFSANIHQVPAQWIGWAKKNRRLDSIARRIADTPAGFRNWLAAFEEMVEKQRDFTKAAALKALIETQPLDGIQKASPLLVFKWYSLCLALANHMGDSHATRGWIEKGEALLDYAVQTDYDAAALFGNHRFIAHHNRYAFRPQLPVEIETLLTALQKRFQQRCEAGRRVDAQLGGLCGSIAQNFGFCGPDFRRRSIKYADLAAAAFGGGGIPEFREDALRQYNYRIFAALDAGDFQGACDDMRIYFEIPDLIKAADGFGRLSQWRHALLARFLMDVVHGDLEKAYLRWAQERGLHLRRMQHPWQLWAWNMGRMALRSGDVKTAVDFFKDSLAVCTMPSAGPALNAMALLPLAGLHAAGALKPGDDSDVFATIRQTTLDLNPNHFSLLHQKPMKAVLKAIWQRPEKLFPFSYH